MRKTFRGVFSLSSRARVRSPGAHMPKLSSTGQAIRAGAGEDGVSQAGDMPTIVEQLTAALAVNMARVIDLFREWDDDGNGMVNQLEFRRALPMLGLKVDRADAEACFQSFDEDGSGEISYEELHGKLRDAMIKGRGIELDASLQAGAMGEITLDSKNKIALRKGLTPGVSGVFGSQIDLDESPGAPPSRTSCVTRCKPIWHA